MCRRSRGGLALIAASKASSDRRVRPVAVGMDVDVDALAVGAPDDVGEQVGRQQRVAARLGCVGVGGEERRGPLRLAAVDVQLQHRSLHQLGVEFPPQRLDHRDGIDGRLVVVIGADHPERQLSLPLQPVVYGEAFHLRHDLHAGVEECRDARCRGLGQPLRERLRDIVRAERLDGVVDHHHGRDLDEIAGRLAGRRDRARKC